MLTISPTASAAIDSVLEAASVPDGAGLRLTAGPRTERGMAIEIAFVTAPDPSDAVIETDAAADVFIEPVAAEMLDDQVLDAQLGPDGAIRFTFHEQASGNGH